MDNTNNYIHDGGKFLAKGSFGCVYKPALKCKDKPKRLDGYVSKIMRKDYAEIEIEEQKEIDKIDPNYYYHLRVGEVCIPDKPDKKNDNKLTNCDLHLQYLDEYVDRGRIDILQDNYRIVHIEDGGMGLDDWMIEMDNLKKLKNIKYCETMLYNFTRIIYALDELNRHTMGHFDIKMGNIVYNDKKNRFNLIDFGFISTYDEFIKKHKNWGVAYWVNPIERAFAPYTKRENDDLFFEAILIMAKGQFKFSDFVSRKSHEFNYLKKVFKRYFTGYRNTFTSKYNRDGGIYFNPYGLDAFHEPSDQMVYDYIEFTRELIKKGKSDKQIKETIQQMIISNLDTFSMSLVMTEMLSKMLSQHKKGLNAGKLLFDYGKDTATNGKLMKEIDTISGFLGNFYRLMLKMNVPSFPKRISTSDALEYYINEIYQPIRQKYMLVQLDFMEARMKKKGSLDMSPIRLTDTDLNISAENTPEMSPYKFTASDLDISASQSEGVKRQSDKNPVKKLTMKKKQAQKDLVFNPLTGRYVNKKGQVAKTLLKRGLISASKSADQPRKSTKKCTPPKVLNPATNRCINKSGITYKKIRIKKQAKTADKPADKNKTKKCPPTKILNPQTNRCVNKDGAIGMKLLKANK